MNKKMLATMMAMVLVLPGCGGKVTDTAEVMDTMSVDEADSTEALKLACLAKAEYGDILDLNWEGDPLAPSMIIDDYVSGRWEYLDQYYTIEDKGYILATAYLGDAHISTRRYYPEATCSADLTAKDLIKGYDEQTLPWVYDDS